MINQAELDSILASHKAEPVGSGYIDVIVKQENVHQLIEELISNNIRISRITWWEHLSSLEKRPSYGMGGQEIKYYDGWFSELCFGDDEISTDAVEDIMKVIENKEFIYSNGESIYYKRDQWLTPALWLEVPDEWESQ